MGLGSGSFALFLGLLRVALLFLIKPNQFGLWQLIAFHIRVGPLEARPLCFFL